jgi:hypothetical protein
MSAPVVSLRPPPPVPSVSKMGVDSRARWRKVGGALEDWMRHVGDAVGAVASGATTSTTTSTTTETVSYLRFFFFQGM